MTQVSTSCTSNLFHLSNVCNKCCIVCHNGTDSDTAALVDSSEPVIIGAAPPYDSNMRQGKWMFCNQKSDRLGPQCLTNKAETRVKKTTITMGSPERIMIEDLDKVNVPEGRKDPH